MSKTFGTKNKIVKLLKEKPMTVTEISAVLGLSKATVSQHMAELENMSMIKQVDNQHFKKVKFYRLSDAKTNTVEQRSNSGFRKMIIPSVLAILIVGIILGAGMLQKPNNQVRIGPDITNTTPGIGTGTAAACPMIRAFVNGTHANESLLSSIVSGIASGSPCSLAYVSGNKIGNLNYTSSDGTVQVPELGYRYTINQTAIANLKAEVDGGECSSIDALAFFGINYTKPSGVACKANIYS
ncbi:MAG: winged helix-turn-helix domain-containing protein [Methanothrix sp.]